MADAHEPMTGLLNPLDDPKMARTQLRISVMVRSRALGTRRSAQVKPVIDAAAPWPASCHLRALVSDVVWVSASLSSVVPPALQHG